jgi:uncharacterized membrane protein (DUF106 family)
MLEPLYGVMDLIFSPITGFPAYLTILIISIIITLLITGIGRLVTNRKLMKELKEKMKKVKEELKKAQKDGDKEKMNQSLSEMMKINKQHMKQSFKSLAVSMVIIILILPWVRHKYGDVSISIPFSLPFIGSSFSWILWYILISFTVGWITQKLLGGYY